ncbi:MAG TPA: outer membrane beta-barrel protein [Vicinamibacteria bacterium]|nr:outer membrane beta-barrel protein [Vicinamibacteria bacterium]
MEPRLVATALLLIVPAAAPGQTVEITPLIGYRVGGSFAATVGTEPAGTADYDVEDAAAFGVHLGVRVAEDGEIEVLYSRQDTRLASDGLFTGEPLFDLALETWQLGGNYLFAEEGARLRPYIGAGLGITRLLPEPAALQDETRFSASFGAGIKVRLARHLGLRLEARGFFTVLESDGSAFCQTGGPCLVHAKGSDISQGEVRAGLVLRF